MIKGLSEMLMGFAPLVLKPHSSFGPHRSQIHRDPAGQNDGACFTSGWCSLDFLWLWHTQRFPLPGGPEVFL